jgi:hypothetical protein
MLLLLYEIFISLTGLFYFYIATRTPEIEIYPQGKGFKPRILVMVPCKGREIDLEGNLRSIKSQDCRNFDVIAITDNKNDSALPEIRRAGIRHIVTSKKFTKGSGKVNALSTAMTKFTNYDVHVIADSDIKVGRDWLEKLVAPLSDKNVGLSTAYPYFNAVGGFWSRVKTVWGFVGDGMMESRLLRFGWGGSLAFRRELIEGNLERFSNYLSDDIAITSFVNQLGLKLAYVPSAAPVVDTKDGRAAFWEWANRQTALSIKGSRRNFYFGVLFYLFDNVLLLSGILLAIFVSYWFALLLVPRIIGVIKMRRRLRESCRHFYAIAFAVPVILLANLLIANCMSSIEWRGRKYDCSAIRPKNYK